MRDDFRALMFGPGLPPAGIHGTLSISVTGAEIVAGQRTQRAPLSLVTLRAVGFDKPGVEVAWSDIDGAWAAHVLDPAAARQLLTSSALSGTPQATKLMAGQRKAAVRFSVGRMVLALLLLLPIVLLIVFALSAGKIAGWIADRVPIPDEVSLGRQAFDSMRGGLILKNQGPAYEAAQSIVARLTRDSRFKYEVHVGSPGTELEFAL